MAGMEKYLRDPYAGDEYFSKIYREHFGQSFQAINFCKYLKPVDPKELAKRKVYLNKKECYKGNFEWYRCDSEGGKGGYSTWIWSKILNTA